MGWTSKKSLARWLEGPIQLFGGLDVQCIFLMGYMSKTTESNRATLQTARPGHRGGEGERSRQDTQESRFSSPLSKFPALGLQTAGNNCPQHSISRAQHCFPISRGETFGCVGGFLVS
jgi:hypothetical protein